MRKFDLNEIKHSIIEELGWPEFEEWTNFHFNELSNNIEKVTGDRISKETLKRIFGKRKVNSENYQPQAFTQIALVKFIDSIKTKEESFKTKGKTLPWRNRKPWLILFTFVGVLFIVLWTTLSDNRGAKYSFSCVNPVDSFPFTAIFRYDISEIDDSVFCIFGNSIESCLPPDKHMINYFFDQPDIYTVLLYTRKQILDSLNIIAWSKEWTAGSFPNSRPKLFKLFKDQTFYRQDNYFYASPKDLEKNVFDWHPNDWTKYKFIYPFNKSLDELVMETRVMNNPSTGSLSCYDTEISLFGDSANINFKFTQQKCSRYAGFQVSEKKLDGKFDDLSPFSVDMSNWLDVKVISRDNQVKIFLSDTLIFEDSYNQKLGNLTGIAYSFFGSGKIDYLEIRDIDNTTFYQFDFMKQSD